MAKAETVVKVVKFLIMEKKLIKFQGDNTEYKLSEKVAKYDHAKYGVKPGVNVDVSIKENEVTYLRLSENQTSAATEEPKEEPKATPPATTETKPETTASSEEVFRWTIAGVPASKEVISFKEGKVKWYQVPEEIKNLDWDKLNFKARVVVDVTVGEVEVKGEKKASIKSMKTIEEVKQQEQAAPTSCDTSASETTSSKKSEGYVDRSDSIERQCAVKAAAHILNGLASQVSLNDIDLLKAKMKDLAQEALNFIRNK